MGHKSLSVWLLMIAFLSFGISSINADNLLPGKGTVTGRVVDKQKQPYFPVTVHLEGTSNGVYTNTDGVYKLHNVTAGDRVLVVSGMGVKTKKVAIHVVAGETLQVPDIEVDDVVELDEVTVIGKSQARRQQELAYAISVLDIQKAYTTTAPLSKLLNNVSSVRVREDGGVGSNYNFSLNGFSGNQVKFFLDGVPMDNFGSSFNLSNISVNMAERVDVYKGVLPVSLGADALGGAVNIISRRDANYLDATYSIGSFNTHRASVNGAYTNRKGFTVRANAFYNYSDNDYKVYVPIVDLQSGLEVDTRWAKRFNDNYQSAGMKIETGIVNKPYADYLLLGLIASGNDKDVQTGATMEAVYGGVRTESGSFIPSIRYKKDDLFLEGLSVSLYGAYSSVNTSNLDTLARRYNWLGDYKETTSNGESYYTDSKIKNREWLSNTTVSYMIDNHQSLTLNNMLSAMKRRVNDKVRPDDPENLYPQELTKNVTGLGWQINYERWNANVFGKMYYSKNEAYKLFDEFKATEHWEKLSSDQTNFGYGAALTYFIFPFLQAKLSYEQAYRLPESSEIFGDGLNQQRNPDLKPESSHNLNAGLSFDHRFGKHRVSAEGNFIYRNAKDFIHKSVSLTSNPTTGYENLGKVLTRGFEGSVRYEYKELLHAGANFTFQDIIDNQQFIENNGSSYVGKGISENFSYESRLPNIPYIFGHADAGVRFKDFALDNTVLTLDYSINYVHDYYLSFPGLGTKATKKVIPEQLSHDIALGYSLAGGKYSIMAECSNLTNEKLYDNYLLQKPGRAFNVKFRYFFSKK